MSGKIVTRLTEEYKVEYPFVSAGMAFFGASELAIAVCRAGGIGALGVAILSPEKMRVMIREVKQATDRPFHVNFITFMVREEHIQVCIEEKVPIVSFHWGPPPVKFIDQLKQANIKVWQQVGSVEDARKAADSGVDCIIAQGSEAGGHNYGTLPTMILVPEIVRAVKPVMVLAAGGITIGQQVAAALCLGADGVWVGTRLAASKEAYAHPDYKKRLVQAKGTDTRLDSTFGPEMPHFNPMRLLENAHTREFQGKEQLVPASTENEPLIGKLTYWGKEYPLRKFTNFLPVPDTDADLEWMPLLAGQGVGLIDKIQPAEEIVTTMMKEAASTLLL